MNKTSKLIIGTAQFGMNYGINNAHGQVVPNEVCDILNKAGQSGVHYIDTASGYGNSEEVLGESFSLHQYPFRIISKYSPDGQTPKQQYETSLRRLKVEKLYAFMVHNFPNYIEQPQIWEEFVELKEKKLVEHIGFSLYTLSELDYILEKGLEADIVQVPYNILDRQFESYFPILKEKGIEVHTRSVFLQGLFFKDINTFTDNISPLAKYVETIQNYCKQNEIQVQDIALGYVLSSLADGVLIGVDSLSQLSDNIDSSKRTITDQDIDFIRSLEVKEKQLLSPVNW